MTHSEWGAPTLPHLCQSTLGPMGFCIFWYSTGTAKRPSKRRHVQLYMAPASGIEIVHDPANRPTNLPNNTTSFTREENAHHMHWIQQREWFSQSAWTEVKMLMGWCWSWWRWCQANATTSPTASSSYRGIASHRKATPCAQCNANAPQVHNQPTDKRNNWGLWFNCTEPPIKIM